MGEWYQDLIGKEVKYKNVQGDIYDCRVSMIDYHLGFTLQEKGTGMYVYCLRGPSSNVPGYGKMERGIGWRRTMTAIVKQLRTGKLTSLQLGRIYIANEMFYKSMDHYIFAQQQVGQPSTRTCAFAQ